MKQFDKMVLDSTWNMPRDEWCHNTGTTRIHSAINNPVEYSVGTITNIPLYNKELI